MSDIQPGTTDVVTLSGDAIEELRKMLDEAEAKGWTPEQIESGKRIRASLDRMKAINEERGHV